MPFKIEDEELICNQCKETLDNIDCMQDIWQDSDYNLHVLSYHRKCAPVGLLK